MNKPWYDPKAEQRKAEEKRKAWIELSKIFLKVGAERKPKK